jgi:hypothetical protein
MVEGAGVGYKLGKALFDKASRLYSGYREERARSLMQSAQRAYRNPFLVPYLRWKYPDKDLLRAAGHEYPVAIYPAPEAQLLTPESILERPIRRTRQPDHRLLPGSAKYRALAHRLGLKHYDRPCFTMRRITSISTINIECELGPTCALLTLAMSLHGSSSFNTSVSEETLLRILRPLTSYFRLALDCTRKLPTRYVMAACETQRSLSRPCWRSAMKAKSCSLPSAEYTREWFMSSRLSCSSQPPATLKTSFLSCTTFIGSTLRSCSIDPNRRNGR